VILSSDRFQIVQEVAVNTGATSARAQFTIPDLPVGFYQVAYRVVRPDESTPRTSNQLALVIGPDITTPMPMNVARDASGNATITLHFHPQARPGQRVSLLLGTREITADPITATSGTLSFVVTDAPAGEHLLRLRVDGVESPIIDRLAAPPVFLSNRVTIT
jgi:hypothetical protein